MHSSSSSNGNNSPSNTTRFRNARSCSCGSIFSGSSEQQQLHQVCLSGDKEHLWSRLREARSLADLVAVVVDAGYHPVVLPRRSLLRDGVDNADFGAILGQLGVFGAILDCKTADEDFQRELVRRELSLIDIGMSKHSVNLLMHHLELARNVGKAACLVIDDRPAAAASAAESVVRPLQESRHLLAGGLPAVFFGSGAGTVTLVEERDDSAAVSSSDEEPAAAEAASSGGDQASEMQLQQQKRCGFSDMMLVAYESCRCAGGTGARAAA